MSKRRFVGIVIVLCAISVVLIATRQVISQIGQNTVHSGAAASSSEIAALPSPVVPAEPPAADVPPNIGIGDVPSPPPTPPLIPVPSEEPQAEAPVGDTAAEAPPALVWCTAEWQGNPPMNELLWTPFADTLATGPIVNAEREWHVPGLSVATLALEHQFTLYKLEGVDIPPDAVGRIGQFEGDIRDDPETHFKVMAVQKYDLLPPRLLRGTVESRTMNAGTQSEGTGLVFTVQDSGQSYDFYVDPASPAYEALQIRAGSGEKVTLAGDFFHNSLAALVAPSVTFSGFVGFHTVTVREVCP